MLFEQWQNFTGSSSIKHFTMQVPGSTGWPILNDKSYDFYKDPVSFLKKNIETNHSKVFASRFLNKPTIFVCSNEGVADTLNDSDDSLEMGYEAYVGKIFGPNVLFSSGVEAQQYRKGLSQLMAENHLAIYEKIINKILERRFTSLHSSTKIHLYKFFKEMFTELCLAVFLGVDFEESKDLATKIMDLGATHWHGIISIPLDLKIPGVGTRSTFSKGLQAKEQLLDIIQSLSRTCPPCCHTFMSSIKELKGDVTNQHLLLFTSALLPKVLASVCATVCCQAGTKRQWQTKAMQEETFLDHLVLEAMRLNTPLLGGRRVATKDCIVGGYAVPKGHAVVYMTHMANRDEAVFDSPDTFLPSRWEANPCLKNKLYVYGLGPRACVGQEMADIFLKSVLKGLFSRFSFDVQPTENTLCKYIPVFRTKEDVQVTVHCRS